MRKFTKVAVLLAVFAVLFCVFSCGSEEEKAMKEAARIVAEKARIEEDIRMLDDSIQVLILLQSSVLDSFGIGYNSLTPDECHFPALKLRLDSAKKGLLKDPFLPHCDMANITIPANLIPIRDSINSVFRIRIKPYTSRLDSLKHILKEFSHESEDTTKPRIYDYDLCMDEVIRWDTVGYQLCCKKNNACWNQVDSLGVRLPAPVLKYCDSDCVEKITQNAQRMQKMNKMVKELENADLEKAEKDSIFLAILEEYGIIKQNAKNPLFLQKK